MDDSGQALRHAIKGISVCLISFRDRYGKIRADDKLGRLVQPSELGLKHEDIYSSTHAFDRSIDGHK